MKTVIFYANPNTTGHTAHILEEVVDQLKQEKKEFVVVDLYKENFDPIMHANEHYTNGGYEASAQTKKYQQLISDNDKLVFIYPVWWNSMPAMMKGFFDKVFTGRLAFKYVKFKWLWFAVPFGLWTKKRAVCFVTTGARWWQTFFLGYRYKKLAAKDVLGFCGLKAKTFDLNNCGKWDDSRRKEVENLVKKGLKYLR